MMSCDTYFEKMRAYQPTSLAIRAQLWTNHDDQINTNEYNETESVRDTGERIRLPAGSL